MNSYYAESKPGPRPGFIKTDNVDLENQQKSYICPKYPEKKPHVARLLANGIYIFLVASNQATTLLHTDV